ncbi:MAG TPA: AI-2E family transporter [Gemmatimonadaceae bacterium]
MSPPAVVVAEQKPRIGPILGATVTTVLLIWLFYSVAEVLLLLFIAVIVSLYLGSVTDFLVARLPVSRPLAFTAAIFLTLGAIYSLGALLVPPVVEQTQQLFSVLPNYITAWQEALQRLAARFPRLLGGAANPQAEMVNAIVAQIEGVAAKAVPTVLSLGHQIVNVVSILVMGIYMALYPGLYREWLIALFPPVHRDTVRDVMRDIGTTLKAWIQAQLLAMTVLAALTALGLYILRVPYWLTFGIFVGAVVIVPFFGTLVGTLLPALFVLGGDGFAGIGPGGHFLLVIALGVIVHIVEGNVVLPLITAKRVEIPPVLSMMAVLIVAKLFGVTGVVVAVPMAAVVMVLIRRVVIHRLYEGQSFRRHAGDRVLVLRVPAPDAAVIAGAPVDVLQGQTRRTA